jgi:hypothetical protein
LAEQGVAGRQPSALLRISHNPARRGAAITYSLPVSTRLSLRLFDASGRLTSRLLESKQAAGDHRVMLPPGLASGVYFVRLETEEERAELKFVVVK